MALAVSSTLFISIISVLVAMAGIAIGAFFARKQLSRKRLSYSRQITQLVNVHSEAQDRITIFYGERQIQQAHLIEIKLKNTGNRPIKESDFERPLTIELGGGFAMTAEVADVNPLELKPEVVLAGAADKTDVQLQPLLLNTGDSLALKILASDFPGEIHFDYRIVGVNKLIDAARQQTARSRVRRFIEPFAAGVISVVAVVSIARGLGLFESNSDDFSPLNFRRIYHERPRYAPPCHRSSRNCASPFGLFKNEFVFTTPNVVMGRTGFGKFDPSALTMRLQPGWRSAFALIMIPAGGYSTMAAEVSISSNCPEKAKARIVVQTDEKYTRSQVLTDPGGAYRFQITRENVRSFELRARSLSPGCTLQVVWSGMEFR